MAKEIKPLLLTDMLFSGKATEGIMDVRMMDGAKLASKRLNMVEIMQLKTFLQKFIEYHRFQNKYRTNISEPARDDD